MTRNYWFLFVKTIKSLPITLLKQEPAARAAPSRGRKENPRSRVVWST